MWWRHASSMQCSVTAAVMIRFNNYLSTHQGSLPPTTACTPKGCVNYYLLLSLIIIIDYLSTIRVRCHALRRAHQRDAFYDFFIKHQGLLPRTTACTPKGCILFFIFLSTIRVRCRALGPARQRDAGLRRRGRRHLPALIDLQAY